MKKKLFILFFNIIFWNNNIDTSLGDQLMTREMISRHLSQCLTLMNKISQEVNEIIDSTKSITEKNLAAKKILDNNNNKLSSLVKDSEKYLTPVYASLIDDAQKTFLIRFVDALQEDAFKEHLKTFEDFIRQNKKIPTLPA